MEAVISFNDIKLGIFLDSCAGDYHYVSLSKNKKEIEKLLRERALIRVDLGDVDERDKDEFIQSYVDIVGKLGQEYNSISWWSTNLSAKNQFGSKLFENLYKYYYLTGIIGRGEIKKLLIINPPKSLSCSLVRYFRRNRIKYRLLGHPPNFLFSKTRALIRYLIAILLFVLQTSARIHITRKFLKKKMLKQPGIREEYVVMRTWFFQNTLANQGYSDSFFGMLPSYLVNKGEKLLVIAGIMGEFQPIVKEISRQKEYLILPLELFLDYSDLPRAIKEILFHRVRIERKVMLADADVTELVQNELDTEFNGSHVLSNYLNYCCMKKVISRVRIRTFVTIFENNAWERMGFLALRRYSPGTYIIGYQHPPLFKAAVNMMISSYEKNIVPVPDKINTIGIINKRWLEEHGGYDAGRIAVSCALRMEIPNLSEVVQRKSSHKILLVLGGVSDRAIDMLNFVSRGMEKSGYRVVIRPHPELPLQRIADKLDFDLDSSDVFSISENISVKADLQAADIVLYDASTIALQALYMGIPVIHIALRDMLSFDPLVSCNFLKGVVAKEEELLPAIERIYQLPDRQFAEQQREAQTYVKDYIYPCTEERLSEFIV